ncbi:hypothetical protein EIP91_011182 [Steccherinum ochraceum]|uniref:Uncharacterized protein n=1 Tax=Steccherinum ochraceum TaxID=92696 RepID=A0A4R0RMR0_9APHY|nr:hypothetical protein EIP91_011182 [Steccherinum ochraceum]
MAPARPKKKRAGNAAELGQAAPLVVADNPQLAQPAGQPGPTGLANAQLVGAAQLGAMDLPPRRSGRQQEKRDKALQQAAPPPVVLPPAVLSLQPLHPWQAHQQYLNILPPRRPADADAGS